MATYYSRFQRNWKPSDIVDFVKINPLGKWEEMMKKWFRGFGAVQFDMEHEAVVDWIDNSYDRSERFAQELYSSWTSNPDHAGQVNAATLEEWKARQIEISNWEDSGDEETFVNGSVLGSEEATPPPPQLIALLDLAVADVADQSQLQDAELKEALYRD
ncbi:hypothetical protein DAEQUDRAFT_762062 [Daedalea quercina L-15889]|uniref:Uncharacterized protein n=1 Tax=Daedalea quercina L-15889 TaxID=1314783 RepID=A0A165TLG5_9APHY|nr:hypothetical protein DAEQUDRAFT_762062 [Daedalea quercina L-15889]